MRLKPWMWPAAIFAVPLIALVAGLFIVERSSEAAMDRQQTEMAQTARDYFVAFAREEGIGPLIAAIDRQERVGPQRGFRYALISAEGRMLAGADVISSLDMPDSGWRTVVDPDEAGRHRWRVLSEPIGGGRTLVVAEDLTERGGLRRALVRGSTVALVLICLGAAAGGLVLQAALQRRTRDIARTAEAIASGQLSARVPRADERDAFGELARAINAMLTRIEELMTGMRTVTDSVAHDLRTPLTRLHGALSRALAEDADAATRTAAIEQAESEAAGALATLSALLDIARAESGLSRELLQTVDVVALAKEMGELFGPALEDAGQQLTVEAPEELLVIRAHETLLRQALGNLLHNAVMHAGPGAHVKLRVAEQPDGAVRLRVCDDGPGVPAELLGRVQERFVRLEPARTRPGSGLGLAIVAACAKLHGGRLLLEDNAPGLRATLELPGRKQA